MFKYLIVCLAIILVGCQTTTTYYPDGRIVEETTTNPEMIMVAIQFARAVNEYMERREELSLRQRMYEEELLRQRYEFMASQLDSEAGRIILEAAMNRLQGERDED
jgi:hypothetical protein